MPASTASPRNQLKVLARALMTAPLVLAIVAYFSLAEEPLGAPVPWAVAAVVIVGLASAAALHVVGYRVQPLTASADPVSTGDQARTQFQTGMILRFAISEAPVLVGLAAAFVVTSGGFWVYLVGMAVSLLLMARHVWPGEHAISRTEQAFERAGTTSWLREALDRPPAAGRA